MLGMDKAVEPANTLPRDMVLPGRLLQGAGCLACFGEVAASFGERGVVIYGRSAGRSGTLGQVLEGLPSDGVLAWRYDGGEPTLEQVEDVLQVARGHGAQWIAGIGGGSVMDCAKAAAGLLHAPGAVAEYHAGREIGGDGVPFLAVPTTAGSGSEATMVAVLSDPLRGVKRSIRHPHFVARAVWLDAEVMQGLSAQQAACSGMDALVQAIESYCSRNRTWFTDAMARQAMQLILACIERFFADRRDVQSAQGMLMGSYLAGLALSGARLGVVHGLAHPVGMQAGLGHGLVCAMALPHVLRFNRESDAKRFAELDVIFGGSVDATVERLLKVLGIPSDTGKPLPEALDGMIDEVVVSGSTAANPREVTRADAAALLRALYRASDVE